MKVEFGTLYGRILYNPSYRSWKVSSNFALWIDGVCYGVFSRVRDAMRKYRSMADWRFAEAIRRDSMLPAWIETVDTGKIVKRIVGEFTYAN